MVQDDETHPVPGVRLRKDRGCEVWEARYERNRIQHAKSFSVKKHGYENGKLMAIEWRRKMEQGLSPAFSPPTQPSTTTVRSDNDEHPLMSPGNV